MKKEATPLTDTVQAAGYDPDGAPQVTVEVPDNRNGRRTG